MKKEGTNKLLILALSVLFLVLIFSISSVSAACAQGLFAAGNDIIEAGEQCSGNSLGGSTCQSLGFTGGTLSCDSDCNFDTSLCSNSPSSGGAASSSSSTSGSSSDSGVDLSINPEPSAFANFFNFKARYNLWVKGGDFSDLSGETIKWGILLLLIFLIYSSLDYSKFPESAALRLILAVITGFLVTFFITTKELLTAMQSYSALGIALTVFFPILILTFFTIMVASKASPMGIFVQRIVWIIYSVYLFVRTGIFLLLKNAHESAAFTAGQTTTVLGFINVKITQGLIDTLNNYDMTMLVVLFVVSIAVFIIMVISNKPIVAWLNKEKRDAEIEAARSQIERADAYDKARSDKMQGKKD